MLFIFPYNMLAGVNGSALTTALNVPNKSIESKQAETSSLVFTPNVIVHITSDSPLIRCDLKVRVAILLLHFCHITVVALFCDAVRMTFLCN